MNKDDSIFPLKKWPFSKLVVNLTLFLLLMGLLFSLGQTVLLSFEYFNTFQYIDFLINAVLIIPFIIFILVSFSAFDLFILKAIKAVQELSTSIKVDRTDRKSYLYGVIYHIIPILGFAIIIFYMVYFYKVGEPKTYFVMTLGFLLVLALLTLQIILQKYSVQLERKTVDKRISETLDKWIFSFSGMIYFCLFTFAAGTLHVDLQKELAPDSIIILKSENSGLEANILASNSNVVAAFISGELQIIHRNEIIRIKYKNKSVSNFTENIVK